MNYAGKPFLPDPLTEREIDVLSLMADGLSNSEIAEKLFLGLETVRWHTKQIYSKLGVHSRMQASLRARQLGILAREEGTPSAPPPVSEVLWLHNLPVYTTPIVGRDHELHELDTLINNPAVRLITIVGSGGMGKTRLSAELARMQLNNFVDGVYFIPLVSVRSAADLEQAILNGMNLALKEDTPPLAQVVHHLKTRHILLLLDNFEHVLDGVELVATLLEGTTSVKILVTSHISLNLREEWVRTIDPLSVPEANDTSDIADYSAVQLFDVCVKRVRGDFVLQNHLQAVIEICRAVQGIPIAIELAAAWLKTLSCEDVARAIRANIDFLATKQRDVQERHRSIQAVFDYAWNLLTEDEQRVFRRLSVFRGGFPLPPPSRSLGLRSIPCPNWSANRFCNRVQRGCTSYKTCYASTRNANLKTWMPRNAVPAAAISWPGQLL